MFKNPLSKTKTSAPIRGSDRRKLKQRVIQEFYDISPELGDLLVPEGLMCQKITNYAGVPSVVYLSSEGDPLWFTIGKASDYLIPTVYTLWKKYDLLPWLSTPAAVIPVLVGGADLMVPGVFQTSSLVSTEGQLVSIVQLTSSPSMRGPPLAVGRLAVDLATLKDGGKGKAVHVLQTWKDCLFDMGTKAEPPAEIEAVEDEGSSEDASPSEPTSSDEEQESTSDDGVAHNDSNRTKGDASGDSLPPDESLAPASTPKISTSAPSEPAFSKEEVSNILRTAVLQAIGKTKMSSALFPIPASTFYSSYILPSRPAFISKSSPDDPLSSEAPSSYPQIDIKHSSYKSLVAFFKILDKQQILTLKDMNPEPLVMSVSATQADVIAHRPYISLRDVQIREQKRVKGEEEKRSKVPEIEVTKLWKPQASVERFFSEVVFNPSGMYTYSDLKSAVNQYVTARQLTNPQDQSYVNVGTDEVLLSTVCAKSKAPGGVEFLKRDEVVRRISEKMQSWYEVRAKGKEPVLKKGELSQISVVVKARQGRKSNTLVTGFEPFFLEAEEMADELKRLCAASTSVSPIHGKASGLAVLVQGKQIKLVTQFLLSKGVPKEWIMSVGTKTEKKTEKKKRP